MDTIVVLSRNQMGSGEPALGQKVLGTFLKKSIALSDFHAILFYNEGVKLVAADSPVLTELRLLEERGVDLIPCGTCLAHYGVEPAVGEVSDMDTIVREMDRAGKIIQL